MFLLCNVMVVFPHQGGLSTSVLCAVFLQLLHAVCCFSRFFLFFSSPLEFSLLSLNQLSWYALNWLKSKFWSIVQVLGNVLFASLLLSSMPAKRGHWKMFSLSDKIKFFLARCLKTINSKKYGVDLVCFTSHPTTVIYSSKNGWDGMSISMLFIYLFL